MFMHTKSRKEHFIDLMSDCWAGYLLYGKKNTIYTLPVETPVDPVAAVVDADVHVGPVCKQT